MAVKKKYALGRGLDALISTDEVSTSGSSIINEIDVNLIDANPNQPRREFDSESLQELADSIEELGIVQPITLRRMDDGRYQIIAGERRWRASVMVGLSTIPAYIRTADDENMMEMALIENIQRQDLNPLEIALAYQHLIDHYGLTQEKLSDKVGKKRATVANYLRLLKLPAPVQVALQNGEIDPGHARALLALDDPKAQVSLFRDVQQKGYSVRQVEDIVKKVKSGEMDLKTSRKTISMTLPKEYEVMCGQLSQALDTSVKISVGAGNSGRLTFSFKNADELKSIIQKILHN